MGDTSESPFTLRKKRINLRGYYQSAEQSTTSEKSKAPEDEQESLQHILKTQSLDQLLQTDINLRREIKELDDNMKLLVFDNYNKFITAETTIRQMREKVETMEDEMTKLSARIEKISENSEIINESLQTKKKQIDVLVGVHKLLQKLQFLVDLPRKLKTAVDNENYRDAVNYYKVTYAVLDKYKHIPSFQPISQQCIEIVTNLEKILQVKFFNEEESMDDIISYGNLLLDLKQSSNENDITSRIIVKFISRVLKMFDTTFDESFDHQIRVLSGYFADILPLFIKLCKNYEANEDKEILESLKKYQCPESLIENITLMKNDNTRKNNQYYEKVFIFSLLDLHFDHIKMSFEGLIKDDINSFSKEKFITVDILDDYNPGKFTSLLTDNIVKMKILTKMCDISENDFLDALPERFGSLFDYISEIFVKFNRSDLKSKGYLIYMLLSPSIFGKLIEFIKIESQDIPSLIGYGDIVHPIRKRIGAYENHLIDASTIVLTQFVHLNSSIIGQMFQKTFEGKDWINIREPQFVNNAIVTIVNEIISLEKIISSTLSYWKEKGLISFITKDSKGHSRKESHSETRFNNFLQRKIDYFQDFELNPKDIFIAIIKRSFKTLLEMIRLNTFSMHGYQQVQVDMYYVKKELSNVFLDPTLLDLLLDDILTNAKERCIEPKPFDENILENIYESMEI